jgi:hypothetical protein
MNIAHADIIYRGFGEPVTGMMLAYPFNPQATAVFENRFEWLERNPTRLGDLDFYRDHGYQVNANKVKTYEELSGKLQIIWNEFMQKRTKIKEDSK